MRHHATRPRAKRLALLGVSALLVGSAFSASCDTADRLRSKVVAVNFLLEVGDPFDVAPRRTDAIANFMSVTGPIDEPEAVPVTGADASLEIEDVAGAFDMAESQPGVYLAGSGTGGNPSLVYTSGADYTITLHVPSGRLDGTYTTRVQAPPRTEVDGLPDTGGGETVPAGVDLVLQLQGTYDQGLLIVLDSSGNIVFDNRPTNVQSAIDFVFGEFDGELVIPGSAISASGSVYGVIIAGLDSAPSSGISSNLNILTRFYAGSAETALIITTP